MVESLTQGQTASVSDKETFLFFFNHSKSASTIGYWQRAKTNPTESRDNVDPVCSLFHPSIGSKRVDSCETAPYGDFLLQLPTFLSLTGKLWLSFLLKCFAQTFFLPLA